jgi:eukaryotic-like serine/threonine-protein kinase
MNQSDHQGWNARDGEPTLLPDRALGGRLAPGVRIGQFELQTLLGRGGMGEVWKAWDPKVPRAVVIKLVPRELQHAAEAMARVKTTFKLVHELNDRNICPLYLLDEDPRFGWYLVMKYIDGQTLSSYRATYVAHHGSFPLEQVVKVLRPVADALDYAHERRVVHRDIKPQNILVVGDADDVLIVDFGLAAEIRTTVTHFSQVRMDTSGTRPYMAPEQWKSQYQDAATDQYALAVVAYELLAGRLPFESDDFDILRASVLQDPPEPIEGMPDSVNRALLIGLAKQRKERFATCGELIRAMQGELSAQPMRQPTPEKPAAAQPNRVDAPKPTPVPAAAKPQRAQPEIQAAAEAPTERINSIGMKMVRLPSGEFWMGSDESPEELVRLFPNTKAEWYRWEQPRHRVQLTRPFEIGRYPVTVREFRAFVEDGGYKTEAETGGGGYQWTGKEWKLNLDLDWRKPGFVQQDDHPVVLISWNDAIAYCKWLSRKEGTEYRLPTEAEWEYACRAGTTTRFCFGDDFERLVEYGWHHKNSGGSTHPVGQKKPNGWGLCDMHGNVWEWCQDWFDGEYYKQFANRVAVDPAEPSAGSFRVFRGGSWRNGASRCRSAFRSRNAPGHRFGNLGFRLARSVS